MVAGSVGGAVATGCLVIEPRLQCNRLRYAAFPAVIVLYCKMVLSHNF
jgi:hypothetical protein